MTARVRNQAAAADPRPGVAVFATQFGAYSQTFIFDEVSRHQRYRAEVFARNRLHPDRFAFDPVHALAPVASRAEWARWALYTVTTYSRAFWEQIREGRFAVIHAHFGPGSVYALPYALASGLPLVVTVHGYDVPLLLTERRFQPKNWRYWAAWKLSRQRVDRFLAASDELAGALARLGVPPERIAVWRLGVDIPAMDGPPPRRGDTVVLVGRFVEKKGFEYGLRAFARVATKYPRTTLHIIGEGERRGAYEALCQHLGIRSRVRFHGALSHPDVLGFLTTADVLMCPSVVGAGGDRESGILVAKEAGARFVPVIGTVHGGIPEIIEDSKTGFLVPERDVATLARRLGELLADPDLRIRLGRAARAKMEREYDIAQRVAVLEQHYDEVIAVRAAMRRSP